MAQRSDKLRAKPADSPANATTESSGYLVESRRPLTVLAFLLPAILCYELGTQWLLSDTSAGITVERRVIAFNWVRSFFAQFGATGTLVAPLATVALLLGWHVFNRDRWRVRPTVQLAMLAESIVLALPILLLGALVAAFFERGFGLPLNSAAVATTLHAGVLSDAVLGLGAGVYEELVFRLIAFAVLHTVLCDFIGVRERAGWVLIVAVTSITFSAYHYLGPEAFTWQSFVFRTLAGVWLSVVFLFRGFGVAAGCHATYNIGLLIAPTIF
ncbi:MAG: CPBP family intramembrane glutamic endopeptidase [Planctomycetota bacterium]